MTVYYRVNSERLTEEEYKTKYPDQYEGMKKRRKWMEELNLEPVKMDGAPPADKHDWSREKDPTTGLDGRYCPNVARFPGDPKAVLRHAKQIEEIGKQRGMKAEWHTT